MKTTIIALSVAALIVAAPALAQGVQGKTPGLQHKVSRKHHASSGTTAPREMQARGSKKSYPGAFGYVPAEPGVDRDLEMSRQAGGGGGGWGWHVRPQA